MKDLLVRWLMIPVLLLTFAGAAYAQLEVIITDYVGKRAPVAIVPFGWEGDTPSAPFDIDNVITEDLKRSGRFAPIAEGGMLQKPTERVNLDFDDWRILKVDAVIIGKIVQTGANVYSVQFQAFDVNSQEQLIGYRMPASRGTMRRVAHRAADMIYEKLTGIPGVFGTKVAYVTARGTGDDRLYTLVVSDTDGENQFTIMESTDPIMSPAWSPDSRELAYVSFEGDAATIYVQTLRSGNRIKVSSRAGINGAPAFSPDGRKLVVTLGGLGGNLDIYVLDLATRQFSRLTRHRAIDTEGTWAPDGRSIYFTSDRSGGPQVYRIEVGGGTAERVTFEGSYNARPRLSPDGKRVALVHLDRGNYRIGVLDLDDKDLLIVSNGTQDESPSFAPNSDSIIYATREGRNGVLEMVSADGLYRQRLGSRAGDIREPVWSPFPRY
ncbi:MAG: Tol-Pal system beta propeller repeat protein TolB [Woeseiaceae bacterium]|jgi:TolB protein|nr:Tol-Pal system beta propeller repeat protein TolB [Woeseiaceae bacterium]